MTLQFWIPFLLRASVLLSVFAIGLGSRPSDAAYLFHRPAKLLRSLFAMYIVMPVVMATIVGAFDLHQAVAISLVALAVSPVPPLLPKKQLKAHGERPYAIGLLVVAAVAAVIFIPIAVELLGQFFQIPVRMGAWPIARLVLVTDLAPLAVGMLVRQITPTFALRIAGPAALVAVLSLALSVLPVLFTAWPSIIALVSSRTIVAIAAFVLVGLAVGHSLGGHDFHDRAVLALATATRHPGIALAIGTANFQEQEAVLPAILLYVILTAIFTIPYVLWRRRIYSLAT
jgi:bile acid:Na+ symporter, BASS family